VAAAGARLVDLQYDSTVEARERLRADTGIDLLQIDECDRRRDLDGLASLISTLDGVVSIDNTTIHLAGGLGIPSMVLLPFGSDWRWTLDRDRSLWYPSVRTARQRQPGDWNGPLAEAARFVQGLGTA
jgi:ADP-heptose:LPS heptosyltransferase